MRKGICGWGSADNGTFFTQWYYLLLVFFPSPVLVVKKLNELYKSSVSSCHCLNMRLQRWFLDKQKLMDRINSITAEKLIFSHAVQMVSQVN